MLFLPFFSCAFFSFFFFFFFVNVVFACQSLCLCLSIINFSFFLHSCFGKWLTHGHTAHTMWTKKKDTNNNPEIRSLATRLHFAIELETLPEGMKILYGGVSSTKLEKCVCVFFSYFVFLLYGKIMSEYLDRAGIQATTQTSSTCIHAVLYAHESLSPRRFERLALTKKFTKWPRKGGLGKETECITHREYNNVCERERKWESKSSLSHGDI